MTKTTVTPTVAPAKPWDGFPLYWHKRGYWMCVRDGEEWRYEADALKSYDRYVADANARKNREAGPRFTKRYFLKDAVNLYLTRQKNRLELGELSRVQFAKCRLELQANLPKSCRLTTPLDAFRAREAGDHGPSILFRRIQKNAWARGLQAAHRHIVIVRACLDYAAEKKLCLPPDYADDFDPPSKDLIDRGRRELDTKHGERNWNVDQLRLMLAKAGDHATRNPHLYAQILLCLFAGFSSDDLSAIPERTLDRTKGIVKFPRVKNGKPRMAVLPKVVWSAIDASLAARAEPESKDVAHLLFLNDEGRKCNVAKGHTDEHGVLSAGRNDTIGKNFQRFLKRHGLNIYRAGLKSLRAMCRTLLIGAGVNEDIVAVIMGRNFRYPVDDYYIRGELREQLVRAARHIERQLFPKRTQSRRRQDAPAASHASSGARPSARKAPRRANR